MILYHEPLDSDALKKTCQVTESDGKKQTYSNRFGAELCFAHRLQELYPNANIALIKYARIGTSIDIKGGKPVWLLGARLSGR